MSGYELEPESPPPERPPPRPRDRPAPPDPVPSPPERLPAAIDEPVPLPPDWPREALTFPLREGGPWLLGVWIAGFLLIDLGAWALVSISRTVRADMPAPPAPSALPFQGERDLVDWRADLDSVVPLVVAMGLISAHLWFALVRIASDSASGADTPRAWVWSLGRHRRPPGPPLLMRRYDSGAAWDPTYPLAVAALAAICIVGPWLALLLAPLLATMMLASALADRRLLRPDVAITWLLRRPWPLLAGALGWALVGLGTWLLLHHVVRTRADAVGPAVLALLVHAAGAYLCVVGARAVGVVGRSWTRRGYAQPESDARHFVAPFD